MSTAFQDVAQALSALLLVSPALAGGRVRANPTTPLPAEQASGIAVRMEDAQQIEANVCTAIWRTTYVLEIAARASTGTDPAAAVDALLEQTFARIAAADLSAQGVQDMLADPQIDWQYDNADTPMAAALLRLSVTHHSARATLAAEPITA